MNNFSESEQLTFSTIRIECQLKNGGVGTGTGFFYGFARSKDGMIPAIVTNKHVVEGALEGRFYINLADSEGNPLIGKHESFVVENFQSHWINHPDSDVDLCIMPIAGLLNHMNAEGKTPFFISLDESLILSSEEIMGLTSLEDIIMIGYPNGIWDATNNKPIIRRGITATHFKFNYEGRQEFMIDAACFPGSSGSPVFLFNVGSYSSSGGIVIGSRIKFLGVLYAGPQHMATGEIEIINVPTQQKSVAFSRIPNNLGLVIKANRLSDFEPILQEITRMMSLKEAVSKAIDSEMNTQ